MRCRILEHKWTLQLARKQISAALQPLNNLSKETKHTTQASHHLHCTERCRWVDNNIARVMGQEISTK